MKAYRWEEHTREDGSTIYRLCSAADGGELDCRAALWPTDAGWSWSALRNNDRSIAGVRSNVTRCGVDGISRSEAFERATRHARLVHAIETDATVEVPS